MAELKGVAGQILYVDLTTGRIEKKPLLKEDVENYIGAAGINAKLAMENIEPGCDPLGPKNALIYGVGTFAGTMVPGAARTVVTAKSPVTGYYGTSAAGHFGTMMKFAGYDHLVITGKARRPVYINIEDDKVTIEDAGELWGKDTFEFADYAWQKNPEAWVSCIGPAGENMVNFAVIVQNNFSAYGSCGLGAVMGSKNLKGVVAHGTGEIELGDSARFLKKVTQVYNDVLDGPYVYVWRDLGTLIQFQPQYAGESAAMRNENQKFSMDEWTKTYKKELFAYSATCPSCPVGCKAGLKIEEGKYAGHEFAISCPAGTLTAPFVDMMGVPADEPGEAAYCAELSNRLGLSTIAGLTGILGWAYDLYAQGAITKEDTGGLELVKGNAAVLQQLMVDIAHRRGFGDVLAGAAEEAQRRIGGVALDYKTRKGSMVGKKYKGPGWGSKRWTVLFFGSIVDPRGHGPGNAYSSVTWMPGRSPSVLRRYAERIGIPEHELNSVLTGEIDGYDVPSLAKAVELFNLVVYSVSNCQRPFLSRVLNIETLAELYSSATGLEVSARDLLGRAERIIALQRMFNVREGLTKEKEMYPEGYMTAEDEKELSELLSKYYELHGWDVNTGIPRAETLQKLGLQQFAVPVAPRPNVPAS